jgi:hypothetical protein
MDFSTQPLGGQLTLKGPVVDATADGCVLWTQSPDQ